MFFFIYLHVHIRTDPDYKLKSAAQTPAALHNNSRSNDPEIVGRTTVDDRKTYLNTVCILYLLAIIINN